MSHSSPPLPLSVTLFYQHVQLFQESVILIGFLLLSVMLACGVQSRPKVSGQGISPAWLVMSCLNGVTSLSGIRERS